jgi:hypothetical protein
VKSPSARARLWFELADLFEEDDGSLPEIRLIDLTPGGVERIFAELSRRAEPLDPAQTVWHEERAQQVPLGELSDVGALAAKGRIAPSHFLLSGIRSGGVRLPDLGAFVFPDEVALDYRMGKDWNADVLAAFVELLAELQLLEPGARLVAACEVELQPEGTQKRFQQAVATYLSAAEA